MEQMLQHSKDWAVMHLPEQFRPMFYKPVVQMINGKQEVVMQKIIPEADSARWSLLIHYMISV